MSLEWWSSIVGSEWMNKGSKPRWAKAFGIPLHARAINTYRIIGDLVGGYIYVDEDTWNRSHLQRARICIISSNLVSVAMIELDIGDWAMKSL